MLNVYIRPDFSPDRQRMCEAIEAIISKATNNGALASAHLYMDAAATVLDGALIEFGGHVREAAFDHATKHWGTAPSAASVAHFHDDRRARAEARKEALDEVRIAFASHSFRAAEDGSDLCLTCELQRGHDAHLKGRATNVALIKDVLGSAFPIASTWSGPLHFDAVRYAQDAAAVLSPTVLAEAAE